MTTRKDEQKKATDKASLKDAAQLFDCIADMAAYAEGLCYMIKQETGDMGNSDISSTSF